MVVLVLGAVDIVVRLAIEYLTSDPASEGLRTFLTSPGAGGLAAVCAATIAYMAVRAQLRHNKRVDLESSWWKSFEWVIERALPLDGSTTAMPEDWSLNLLTPMLGEATTDFQRRALRGIVDRVMLPASLESEEGASLETITGAHSTEGMTGPTNSREEQLQASVEEYVIASRNTEARSDNAVKYADRYRKKVWGAAFKVCRDNGWEMGSVVDSRYVVIRSDGGTVVVHLSHQKSPHTVDLMRELKHAGLHRASIVFVSLAVLFKSREHAEWVRLRSFSSIELEAFEKVIHAGLVASRLRLWRPALMS